MNPLRLIALAAALALAACSPSKKAETAPGSGGGATSIRFATDWRAQAEQGGFYQALATGEFAKRGLNVTIIQGGPGVNVPQLLATHAVEMGMGSNGFIVLNLAQEKAPVQAVAAFMQKDPQVLIAHPGQGIRSIADMRGRPIMISDASAAGWQSYLFGDPKPGDALILKDNPEMTQDVLDQARDKMRKLGLVDSGDAKTWGLGVMTDARWAEFFKVASSQGVYPKNLDYKFAYTLQFMNKPKT